MKFAKIIIFVIKKRNKKDKNRDFYKIKLDYTKKNKYKKNKKRNQTKKIIK